MQVRSLMQTKLITATPETSLATAERLMQAHHIRHLPVVSGKHLVGMISDRDLREALPSPATTLAHGEIAYQMDTTPVKTCMTSDLVWTGAGVDMAQATRLLGQRHVSCLPILENGQLVGIVTEMDCLRAFLDSVDTT